MKRSTNFACAALAAALMLPAYAGAQTPQTPPQQQQPATPQQPEQQPATVDQQAARQRLTEARNTLSEITQLPEASQLTGEARAQISQLISNFNELISAESSWKVPYDKVTANLTTLLGPESTDPTAPTTTPPTTGTPGAVGTSGTVDLDSSIREKLVELRRQLKEFEKAAGSTSATDPAATASPSSTPMTTPPTDPTSTPPSTTPPSTTPPSTTPPSTSPATDPAAGAQAASAEIARHIAAIETLLKSEDDSGGITLTKAQLEQLRTHWAALKASIR